MSRLNEALLVWILNLGGAALHCVQCRGNDQPSTDAHLYAGLKACFTRFHEAERRSPWFSWTCSDELALQLREVSVLAGIALGRAFHEFQEMPQIFPLGDF